MRPRLLRDRPIPAPQPAPAGRAPLRNEHGDEILADIGLDTGTDAVLGLKIRGVVA